MTVSLADVGGAIALCERGGKLAGASPSARGILQRMCGDADHVSPDLWSVLDAAPTGEAVIWSPPDRVGAILGCTRYDVRGNRHLLVMREITLAQEMLAQQLGRHRAKTVEMLVFLLAHDLRAPLATIVLNLDTVHSRWDELEPEFLRESIEASLLASSQLRDTIDALVDLVRMGPARATNLKVKDVVDRVVAMTRPIFRTSGHELVVRVDPAVVTIRANAFAVQQILLNLLVNATEASARPMVIELVMAPATLPAPDGVTPAVSVRVRDHGPGISPEVRARMFQPFFTTKPHGTGLGLALARDAALGERGTLALVPVDRGACFEVILPGELA